MEQKMNQPHRNHQKAVMKKAARIIRQGGLVAFPTETVYGLGANALDKKAVRKIFEAKGRPLDNPLIVHIADVKDLSKLARNIPKEAGILTKKFWPGPLTLVLFKKKIVPKEVTAGGNTIAVRMPKNKTALELIKSSGVPIAAPSANLASKPSPTTAKHVSGDLGNRVDLILDGGRTKIGVESTVVDLTVKPFQVLRPGGLVLEELKKVLKDIQPHTSLLGKELKGKVKSPGMKYRHYAPAASLILVAGTMKQTTDKIQALVKKYKNLGKKVGVMASLETKNKYSEADVVLSAGSRKNLKSIAKNLFRVLRNFDKQGVDVILAETFPEKEIGFTIMDRLKKAARLPSP